MCLRPTGAALQRTDHTWFIEEDRPPHMPHAVKTSCLCRRYAKEFVALLVNLTVTRLLKTCGKNCVFSTSVQHTFIVCEFIGFLKYLRNTRHQEDGRHEVPPPPTPPIHPLVPIICLPRSLQSLETRTVTPSSLAALARETCTCAWVNTTGGSFVGKGHLAPFPNIGTSYPQHANSVYN